MIAMKRLIYLALIALSALMTSCGAAYTTLTVSGTPGTVIKNAGDGKILGTIGESRSLQVNLDRDKYYAYLLSKAPQSDEYVPFALEFEEETGKYYGSKFGEGVGFGLACAGIATEFSGLIYMLVGPPEVGGIITGVGAAIGLSGIALGLPMVFYIDNSDVKHCYQYLPSSTNDDIFNIVAPFPFKYQ